MRKGLRTGNSGYCDLCGGMGAHVEFVGSFSIYVCEQGHEWLGPNALDTATRCEGDGDG